jgi:hypothetical protein
MPHLRNGQSEHGLAFSRTFLNFVQRSIPALQTSSRDESFLDLSIDIEQNTSITACLRQFSASETLCQRNKFYCDTCCGLQEAEKRMKIKTLPNVLSLHLKRFKYQEELGRYVKLNYRVTFPFQLRLFNTSDDSEDPDRLYELFAIVVHVGGCVSTIDRLPFTLTVTDHQTFIFRTQRSASGTLHCDRQDWYRLDDV